MRTGAQSQHVKPASRMTRRPCWRIRASNSKLDGLVSLFNHLVRSDDGFSDWEPSSSAWIHRSLLGIECHGTWIPRSAKTASEVNFEPQATTGTPVPGLETQKKRGNKCEWWKKKKGGGEIEERKYKLGWSTDKVHPVQATMSNARSKVNDLKDVMR